MRNRVNRGFTLVEILIVVVILGILAAIVVPQFTNASESAMKSSIDSQLRAIRGQLELYKNAATPNAYPDLITNQWDDLVNGGYLYDPPVNPWTSSSDVVAGTGHADGSATDGWVWDAAEGRIFASLYDEFTRTFIDP